MSKLIIIFVSVILVSCASVTSGPVVQVTNFTESTPHQKLFSLVGVDGRQYQNKAISAGSHIFYIEGFESDPEDNSMIAYSQHTMRVSLEAGNNYSIKVKSEEGVLFVWVNNDTMGKEASSISSVTRQSREILKIDTDIERINIHGKTQSPFEKGSKGRCGLKTVDSQLNQGFEHSITDKKLPDRWNQATCG